MISYYLGKRGNILTITVESHLLIKKKEQETI